MNDQHYIFFRKCNFQLQDTEFVLPSEYKASWWYPSWFRYTPTHKAFSVNFFLFFLIYRFLKHDGRYRAFLISTTSGEVIHYSFVLPKYFRFPFMEGTDLQIGLIWTDPGHRGKGLAKYAVQEIIKAFIQECNSFWYLVADHNVPSIIVAEKNKFSRYGIGQRHSRFGLNLLGTYKIQVAKK